MRWLAVLLITFVTSTTSASPYDVTWIAYGSSAGAPPRLSGEIGERLEREPCNVSCPMTMQWTLGAGTGRLAGELQFAVAELEDAGALDPRDRERRVFRFGPGARVALLRSHGFDLSLRGGLQLGWVDGVPSTELTAERMEVTYEPPQYSMWAVPLGATLRFGGRYSGWYGGVQADLEYTLVRVAFPDEARSGALRTITFGFVVGAMFDVTRAGT
ncbi:MAG TPA: hypothetical protein VIV11_20675 [Kofleriaceae bacterium]